jgi:hypothetical protein
MQSSCTAGGVGLNLRTALLSRGQRDRIAITRGGSEAAIPVEYPFGNTPGPPSLDVPPLLAQGIEILGESTFRGKDVGVVYDRTQSHI